MDHSVILNVHECTLLPFCIAANIETPGKQIFLRTDSGSTFVLTQATAAVSERYISSLERTDFGVPLEVEFEETRSSGNLGDVIVRSVQAPGIVYNVQIWSINGASFSRDPATTTTVLMAETGKTLPLTEAHYIVQ